MSKHPKKGIISPIPVKFDENDIKEYDDDDDENEYINLDNREFKFMCQNCECIVIKEYDICKCQNCIFMYCKDCAENCMIRCQNCFNYFMCEIDDPAHYLDKCIDCKKIVCEKCLSKNRCLKCRYKYLIEKKKLNYKMKKNKNFDMT